MTLRIGVVIDAWAYPFNGTVVSTRRFVEAMTPDVDFRILATPNTDELDERVVPFHKLSIPGFNSLIDSMRVPLSVPSAQGIRQALSDCDVLHIQFPFFLGWRAIGIARELGIPVIASFHVQPENILRNIGLNSGLLTRWLYKLFISAIYNRADLAIAPSQFAADLLLEHGLKVPVEVLSNGVPSRFFDVPVAGRNDPLEVLSVGRLAREKQHRVLIDAINRCELRDRLRLTIIGTGPLEDELRSLIDETGINATVGTATNDELMQAYQRADLFVHTGEIELEGMSVTEAMASANVVLVSDSPGSAARTLVPQADAVFQTGNATDLAQRIDSWLGNPDAREAAAAENRQVASTLSHEASVAQLTGIYQRLVGRDG